MQTPGPAERRLLSIVDGDRLRRVLRVMLDEREFLSPLRHPRRSRASTSDRAVRAARSNGSDYRVGLRAGGVDHRAVRRQLELARADLVPDQLPAGRGAAEVPPLLRRRLHRRVPDRLGADDDARARWPTEISRRLTSDLSRRRRAAGGRCSATTELFQTRSALARPDSVPRVLQRRHRRRRGRQPSDRLDRARRQTASAERRDR